LAQALAHAFRAGADSVEFHQVTSAGLSEPLSAARKLSTLLSAVCDEAYSQSPHIRNEMLGRRELTSQGAKARRELIEAMIERSSEDKLGITGYGPDRAMYEAVLKHTGLHVQGGETWGFRAPTADQLRPVWGAIAQFIDAASDAPATVDGLFERLMAPPIGLKEGPIPVLLVAYLLQRTDDVAIYESGTFQPNLTADLVERLVKAPQRFALKSFSTRGNRVQILAEISKATASLGVGGLSPLSQNRLRNETVLAVAAPLLNLVRRMPVYTRRTSRLSERTLAVRNALREAREPDRLLLVDLPAACGFAGAVWRKPTAATIAKFGNALSTALDELNGAYQAQLLEIRDLLAAALELPADVPTIRDWIAPRAADLEGKVLDGKLQSFVFNLADDSTDPQGWLERIGLVVTNKAVEQWLDEDRAVFRSVLAERVAAFLRVQALHFEMKSRSLTEPFTARKLTLTTPEGVEESRVIYYDDSAAAGLEELVDDALGRAEKLVGGTHGREALTALLVERMVRPTIQQEIGLDSGAEKAQIRKARSGK